MHKRFFYLLKFYIYFIRVSGISFENAKIKLKSCLHALQSAR